MSLLRIVYASSGLVTIFCLWNLIFVRSQRIVEDQTKWTVTLYSLVAKYGIISFQLDALSREKMDTSTEGVDHGE